MKTITEQYSKDISRVLSCYDRILIDGTLPELNFAKGMTKYLYGRNIKIFDYVKFAEPLKDIVKHIMGKANQVNANGAFKKEYFQSAII